MSTISGIGSKGEKNKNKYKGFDINTVYKGKSVETQKTNVPRQHGLQSLGKVSTQRRMPPPANLPSLKSENSGNDPSVNLVPSGGSGWVSKEEKKESSGSGAQQPLSQLQQATPTPPQVQQQQQQHQAVSKTSIPAGGQSSTATRSWSNITGGVQKGGLVSHQSPLFQEEFPSLAQEEKSKEPAQPTKKEDNIKDTQYGPGPSLRPQNVASWREGGGRAVPQPKPEEPPVTTSSSNLTETQQNGPQMSGGAGGAHGSGADSPSQPLPPRHSSGQGPPHAGMPMGPPMGMPPPHHPQYRSMMPPYMYGRHPHGGYPPNYPGFARPPYPPEARFRGPPPSMSHQRHSGMDGEDGQKRPAILSDKKLKDFDDILKSDSNDSGWAGPQGEIDYSEKLVFSDEEDESKSLRDRHRHSNRREPRDEETKDRDRDRERDRDLDSDRDNDQKDDREKEEHGPPMIREAWPHGHPPPHYRGGPRPPHPGMDARGWPPHMHPYEFMGPRGAPPFPFRMPPPPQMRPPYGPPPPVSSPGSVPSRKPDDDDEVWLRKRLANEGEINTAVERARLRREENEKRKDSEMKAATADKQRQLDERSKKKEESKDSDGEKRDSRTASESSDKDPNESRHRDRLPNYTPPQSEQGSNKGYSRNVPPRFQKQQEGGSMVPSGQRQQPPSPGTMPQSFRPGQGHPPAPWGPYDPRDPRSWASMSHFMDPRYGPRPPIDMQGMPVFVPPMARRRNDSHGSGNDSQDSEARHSDHFDRPDPRASWLDRGYPPHAGHFEEMRRHPYFDQRAYSHQDRFEFERRDYDRHEREDERNLGPNEADKAPSDLDQRPALLQRDSIEERLKLQDKEERSSDRSSKTSSDWDHKSFTKESKDEISDLYDDEFNEKSDKDILEEEPPEHYNRGYRRDGRQGPIPTFRAYSSEEVQQREASHRREPVSSSGPSDQNKSGPPKNSLTTLKRSASNMSSSSGTSTEKERERKSDSPKESLIFERSSSSKRDTAPKEHVKESRPPPNKGSDGSGDTARPNPWEIKEQDRLKATKEKEKQETVPPSKDETEPEKLFEERVESPFSNRPPVKKKREDDQDRDRHDRYDDHDRRDRDRDSDRYDRGDRPPRNMSGRGREFVRGRGGSRSRGRGSARGYGPRGSKNREYTHYDRGQDRRRQERHPLSKHGFGKSDDSDGADDYGDDLPRNRQSQLGGDSSDRPNNDRDSLLDKGHDNKDSGGGKDRERRERKEPLLPSSRDKDDNPRETTKSWGRESKVESGPPPPPPQNAWTRDKPLLQLPVTEWKSDDASKDDLRGHEISSNVWQQKPSLLDSGLERSNAESRDTEPADNRDKRQDGRRDDKDNRRRQDHRNRRDRDNDIGMDKDGGKEKMDRRDRNRDRNRDRDVFDHQDDQSNGAFTPRGEPSRRGRGGGRGGRGGGRFMSAPSGRGGHGYGNQNGGGPNGRLSGGGRDGRMNSFEGANYRRDGRRQDNRNQPPPRFSKAGGGQESRGRGSDRGSGYRGRSSRGRGNSAPANMTNKKPILTKQASNEGEEWETASESSEPKNDLRESRDKRETSAPKKISSNQRPFNDRQNSRRMNAQDSRNSVERRTSNKDKPNQKNGAAPPTKSAANGNGTSPKPKTAVVSTANHKENVVFRVDGVVPSDPNAINNAINNLHTKKQITKKTAEIAEPSKSVKNEKEKKDALANIDINNYASVVVIDDQPEVTIDDPSFLFENNEGFQEVTSKKALKKKEKMIEAEQKKTEKEAQKRKDHTNKVVARPKGLTPKTGRVSVKGSKLPPRLAKQKEQREKEKELNKNVMPKIEQWDNELANNIPSPLSGLDTGTSIGTTAVTTIATSSIGLDDEGDVSPSSSATAVSAKTSLAYMSSTPAPAPTISAWTKPINFGAPSMGNLPNQPPAQAGHSMQPNAVVMPADVKMDKGDQHDSGIDVSDQPNSAASSTRSSPSADNKLLSSTIPPSASGLKRSDSSPLENDHEEAKPQRPKTNKGDKTVIKAEASVKGMQKEKEVVDTKPEPIQMPPSFKDSIFAKGDDTSLQLDFRYDESLATSLPAMSERSVTPEKVDQASVQNENINLSASSGSSPHAIVSPTSPATEDLNTKIASVKKVWDSRPSISIAHSSAGSSSENSIPSNNSNNSSSAPTYTFHSFSPEVGSGVSVSVGGISKDHQPPSLIEDVGGTAGGGGSGTNSVSPSNPSHSPSIQRLHSPHPAETVLMSEVDMNVHLESSEKSVVLEPSNVCKVRPQQLQVGLSSDQSSMSVLSSGLTGPMPTVASPPVVITGQPAFQTFQLASQFVPQEQRYTQPSFGFSLSQPQTPGPMGGHSQPPLAAQQSFSQPNIVLPSTPTQSELFTASQLGFTQRSHGFAQPAAAPAPPPAAQPSTIMVSSATSALMSTNIKAQGTSHGAAPGSNFGTEPLGKNLAPSQLSYSGSLGNSSLPGAPSQQLFFYDPHPSSLGPLLQPHSQIIGGSQPSQNIGSSQIIGSQLLPTRTAVQPNSSFFPQAQAASFFPAQQPSNAFQVGAPIQQPSSAHQFPVQAFGSQAHSLGLALQPAGPALEPAPPTHAGMALHQSMSHGLPQQPQQHALAPSGNKGAHFGGVLAQPQAQHHPTPVVQHLSHGQQPQAVIMSSRSNQLKSPPQSNTSYMMNNSGTLMSQGHSSSSKSGSSSGMSAASSGPVNSSTLGMVGQPGHGLNTGGPQGNIGMVMSSKSATSNMPGGGHGDGSSIMNSGSSRINMSMGPPSSPSTSVASNLVPPRPGGSQSRFPNPNAPNFSAKYSVVSTSGSSSQSFSAPPSQQSSSGGVRPPMKMNNMMRGVVPQGSVPNRPTFPNPIQRPGAPPASSARTSAMPPSQPMGPGGPGPKGSNPNAGTNLNPGPLNLNAMNLGSNALLSNMILNAASVITQTVGSMGLQGGPNSGGNNLFALKGPGMGGYAGGPPSRDGPPRPNLPSHQNTKPGSGAMMPSNPPSNKPTGSYPGPPSIKAQQAQQRQAVLNHAANFLNNNKAPANAKTPKPSTAVSVTGSPAPVLSNTPSEGKKPPLAMVSNPGLVGTSVKIDIGASNNSRAPAVTSIATLANSASVTVNSKKITATASADTMAGGSSSGSAETK